MVSISTRKKKLTSTLAPKVLSPVAFVSFADEVALEYTSFIFSWGKSDVAGGELGWREMNYG